MTKGQHTVTKRPKALHIPRRCAKCGKRLTTREVRDSMARVGQGRVKATICPNCLSPADMAEMVIRAASEEYGYDRQTELLYRRPRGSEDDAAWRLAGGVSR
jgi:hypothetical protein